ncbi:MAG: 4-(cytidine 5'-diphospho)-2-C-methyl-D-erythritol kinase [Erysipelotrichaceae bacterium]|nr:4-(cytidine 5'-diphospho)-2-C-methyl-D-erythritol kinase [Erysipelotrichaceae bacterium]MDY5253012.1 4-(cytidine 5'-diphospho)-2-C-methyl-D-erythritol kinase [Erysipelotrichaceae bacterium]
MKERAYAKINLSLDVVGIRADGYHELEMIMVPINFYDVLEMEIAPEMSMEQNVGYLPMNEKNTIIKAINVLREEYGFEENFKIKLTKHIPTQAGLAGGSSDGAAAIRLVRKLLRLNMPNEKMIELATKVGADVAFCCMNRPAVVRGIGDIIEPFKFDCPFEIFLVKPHRGIMTKKAFEMIDKMDCEHPDVMGLKNALETSDYEQVCKLLGNSLEASSFTMNKEIAKVKQKMLDLGFDGSLMTGSGSCVFGITRDPELITKAEKYFKRRGYFVRHTSILRNNYR